MDEEITLLGRTAARGIAAGEALVCRKPFGFRLADPTDGVIKVPGHELEGASITNKVLVFPSGFGATDDDYALYVLKKMGAAPKAVINVSAYPITTMATVLSDVPMVYALDKDPLQVIETGDYVRVDADKGIVSIIKRGC